LILFAFSAAISPRIFVFSVKSKTLIPAFLIESNKEPNALPSSSAKALSS